jgi:hypothetical protein
MYKNWLESLSQSQENERILVFFCDFDFGCTSTTRHMAFDVIIQENLSARDIACAFVVFLFIPTHCEMGKHSREASLTALHRDTSNLGVFGGREMFVGR